MNKKLSSEDITSLVFLLLNILGVANYYFFVKNLYDISNVFEMVACIIYFIFLFTIPATILIGIVLNVIELIKKAKKGEKYWTNIVFVLIFVLTCPVWCEMWFWALMSV